MISVFFTFLLILFTGCSIPIGDDENKGMQEPFYGGLTLIGYNTLQDMEKNSPLIVQVERTGNSMKKFHDHMNYTITEVKVTKVLKGEKELLNKAINIIEFDSMSMTNFDKEKNYVLFLYPHNGKIATNGYWIRGVYQGKFKLDKNNKLFYDANKYGGMMTFQNELSGLSVSDLEILLNKD